MRESVLQVLLDILRRFGAVVGALMNLSSAALLVLDPPAVPVGVIAAGGVAIGTSVLIWAIWDGRAENRRLSAHLDHRAQVASGLSEFRARLDEGNALARKIATWPPIIGEGEGIAQRDSAQQRYQERKDEYIRSVREWNATCVKTLEAYLPHRTPYIERPLVRGPVPAGIDPWRHKLQEEVAQKINWLSDLQRELEAQSNRAAIS